ncbi:alpha/beta hydrolase [uncultured Arcticibacterium sp.]|uniref:alpha/beta hydrolase n=1 Tax=uncultured Arcticibacterium sp. TaxID=2173042 RepID=UPI0030F757EA
MKLKLFGFILLIGIIAFEITFSIPVKYDVESFNLRKGTQYWNLEEELKIGYTKIEANNSKKKEPIIYLHGGPGGKVSNEIIEVLTPLSNEGHDLYFYDQIGSGHSTRLKNIKQYSVERHREDLRNIVDLIGADKVILLGHSWGACLAVNYLQEYPETVKKVVLTGPGPILPINRRMINEIPPDSLNLVEPEFSNKVGNEKIYNWRSKIILKWAYLFSSKLVTDKEVDDFFTSLNQELNKSTDCSSQNQKKYEGGGGYYSHIMTVKSLNQVEEKRYKLRGLNTPLLIVRGQCDNQKWGYTKEYLDLFHNSDLRIIEGVGHTIINKKGEQYYALIQRFLAEN